MKKPVLESPRANRLLIHLGHCDDLYKAGFRELYPSIEAGDGTAAFDATAFDNALPVPSLPFEGLLSPAPIPKQQAPFVHSKVNRSHTLTLLLLPPSTWHPRRSDSRSPALQVHPQRLRPQKLRSLTSTNG